MAERQALGRGLAALLGPEEASESFSEFRFIAVSALSPNPAQPRTFFDEIALEELAHSIRENGVLQPILVQERERGFEIVAGERRWRAAKRAGLSEVPCRIMSLDAQRTLEVALLENIQRDDLNALEEARGYQSLMQRFDYTQDILAKKVGKSRSHIANMLRLLTLPEDLQQMIQEEQLSVGHAKALLSSQNPSALAQTVIAKKLTVRETEAQASRGKRRQDVEDVSETMSEEALLAKQLSELVCTEVQVHARSRGGYSVSFTFSESRDFEEFVEQLHFAFKHDKP